MFEVEPATENALFDLPNVVCTPHLGAATMEAQENVALQVAEQMSDYLMRGAVSNAINMPSITAEEAPRLKPFVKLAEVLGGFVGQMTEEAISEVEILYRRFDGLDEHQGADERRACRAHPPAGSRRQHGFGAGHGEGTRHPAVGSATRQVRRVRRLYQADGQDGARAPARSPGTCFSDGKPRFIQIKGINLDAEVGQHMLYTTNGDTPGIIGLLGTVFGEAGVNIANFALGRNRPGGDAIALLYLDEPIPGDVLEKVRANKAILSAKPLEFDIQG